MRRGIVLSLAAAVALSACADVPFYWRAAKYSKMTNPECVCVQAGDDFTYQFGYEAAQPYSVKIVGYAGGDLPEKVSFDAKTGVLSGNIAKTGEFPGAEKWGVRPVVLKKGKNAIVFETRHGMSGGWKLALSVEGP